jgi:RraA family protein
MRAGGVIGYNHIASSFNVPLFRNNNMTHIGFRILPAAPQPSRRLLRPFAGVATAHVSDNMSRLYAIDAAIRPYHKKGLLLGGAFTVKVPPGDNLMVHKALDMARRGDVIVVDAGAVVTQAIIGEIMSTHAAKRGIAGLVIDGAIRDSAAISAVNFPVYARAVTHRGPYKHGPGEINVPVAIGGAVVHPGDIVFGDEDGIVCIPQDVAAEVISAATAQRKKEDSVLKAIAAGKVDRRWVDDALKQKGCEFPAA